MALSTVCLTVVSVIITCFSVSIECSYDEVYAPAIFLRRLYTFAPRAAPIDMSSAMGVALERLAGLQEHTELARTVALRRTCGAPPYGAASFDHLIGGGEQQRRHIE